MPPPDPDFLAAVRAIESADYRGAARLAERARRKHPNDPDVLLLLAQAQTRAGSPASAVRVLRKAAGTMPTDHRVRAELAFALAETGQPEAALLELDTILDSDPTHQHAVYRKCATLRDLGRSSQAWAWLEPRLATLPASWSIAMSVADTYPEALDPAVPIDRIRSVLADPALAAGDRRALLYRLARWLDRAQRHAEAFAAAQGAAALAPPATTDEHEALLARCTPEVLAAIEPATLDESQTAKAALVCGMPRSGTTITEQILAAHPEAATVGESPVLPQLCYDLLDRVASQGAVPTELTTKAAKKYLKHLASAHPNATVVVDKMPQNFMFLGVIARVLPGCRVIRCQRDPRDIALSCFLQDFDDRHPYSNSLDTLADEILRHRAAAARWQTETSLAVFESHLEKLVADPSAHARELVAFVGLPWLDACLDFHTRSAQVRTASAEQIRQGVNTRGIGRWKNYQTQLDPLIKRLDIAP
ncbi:MAG: tetratricopeptide (TPR) repeat protein [Phycisphaerales bacterium]|jgi:tetratricopeptide (TPR) repeat protein